MVMKVVVVVLIAMITPPVLGQTSSISRRFESKAVADQAKADLRGSGLKGNPTLERHSLVAVKAPEPRKFKMHDLVTIIIREQQIYESESDLEQQKKFDVRSQLNEFFKIEDGQLGASSFLRGKPGVDFKFDTRVQHEAEKEREDRFTTRVTGEIIDVKPNGNLVIEARGETQFDSENVVITLTGIARAVDITADNSVLSTQLADKRIMVTTDGAVRDGSRRGWVTRLLDVLRPF